MRKKILIMGLPGAGKTTLANELAPRLNAVHFNADDVRANINKDLGFSEADRVEHARRMGWLCDRVIKVGGFAIADFICPTVATREAFEADGEAFVIFVDRIRAGAFEDTNRMFMPPEKYDLRVDREGSASILGGTGDAAIASRVRSEKANGTIYRPVPAVSRRAQSFDC